MFYFVGVGLELRRSGNVTTASNTSRKAESNGVTHWHRLLYLFTRYPAFEVPVVRFPQWLDVSDSSPILVRPEPSGFSELRRPSLNIRP